jgi:hypothetical protein
MDASPALAIEYPAHFRGIYDELGARHAPLLERAVRAIRELPVTDDLRPALAYQTWENPQPSFILFPLMYLATAEASGGLGPRHVEYLPGILLVAELLAVADDTVDRCAQRSGRQTFARRFGDASALPFAAALTTLVLERSRRCDDRLFAAAASYLARFFGLELWEREHTFPAASLFDAWLDHRYAQAIWSTQFILDSALILNDQPAWPEPAVAALNRIGQDVDDIVNIVEFRERDGENDDLLCGVVTRPMVLAIRARPELGDAIAALWDRHRPLARQHLSIAEYQHRRAALIDDTLATYRPIRDAILDLGVPATIRDARRDLQVAVEASPAHLRTLMHGLATAFLDRLDACTRAELR